MRGTLNKVMLIGHTGDEVKMHYFENGNCVGRFPLATDESYTNKSGEVVTNTEWHNINVYNKAAEICEKYLKKGDKVYIEGRIKTRKWQDQQGVDRYTTEIQCTDFTFLTPKGESSAKSSGSSPQAKPEPSQSQSNKQEVSETNGDEADDLPF